MPTPRKIFSRRNTVGIDLTPMMDLTFILLITFIITFPLIEQGIPVNLPKANADDLSEEETRTITLDLEGGLFLDDRPLTMAELSEEMNRLGRTMPDSAVMVRADEELQYRSIIEVMKILREAGITRMALVTQAGS